MNINFTQLVTNVDGLPLENAPSLKDISIQALVNPFAGDEAMQPEKKFNLGLLAHKIATGGDTVSISVEEVAILKDRIGRGFPPLTVFFAWNAFEAVESK